MMGQHSHSRVGAAHRTWCFDLVDGTVRVTAPGSSLLSADPRRSSHNDCTASLPEDRPYFYGLVHTERKLKRVWIKPKPWNTPCTCYFIRTVRVHLYWRESDIAFRWVHRKSKSMFTLSKQPQILKKQECIPAGCVAPALDHWGEGGVR